MSLALFLVGILSGVTLRSISDISLAWLCGICFCLCLLRFRYFKICCICCIGICIGYVRYDYASFVFEREKVLFAQYDQNIVGIVDEIPTVGEYTISARIQTDTGAIVGRFNHEDNIQYGDHISAQVSCKVPEDFVTDTGAVFDYDMYLMARDIHHVCKVRHFELIKHGQGNNVLGYLYAVRIWFSRHIDTAFSQPHAGLIRGVLLGDKDGLTTDMKRNMTIAGVIHIAVLSGSNIAMLGTVLYALFRLCSYRLRIVLTLIIVILFVLLSGAEPPATRAGILFAIVMLGKLIHREAHTGRTLLLIAVMMVWNNPFALLHDLSFQLSFLATLGIVYIAPVIERNIQRVPARGGLREVIAGTMGAQIAVTPLLLYTTHAFSLVSLPANVLIGWAVPLLMIVGCIATILSIMIPSVTVLVIFPAHILSSYVLWITKIAAHIPYAQIIF